MTDTRTDTLARDEEQAGRVHEAARVQQEQQQDPERTPIDARDPEAPTPVAPGEDRPSLTTADIAARPSAATSEVAGGDGRTPLFDRGATDELRTRWTDVQTGFVDEPRKAVEDADSLVAEVMQRLADSFARERQGLERQWSQGDQASTEDLRVALRRYRSFFDRLLAM